MSSDEALRECPPDRLGSTQTIIYETLAEQGEMISAEISDEIRKSQRSVAAALGRMKKAGVVQTRYDPTLPVRQIYSLEESGRGD